MLEPETKLIGEKCLLTGFATDKKKLGWWCWRTEEAQVICFIVCVDTDDTGAWKGQLPDFEADFSGKQGEEWECRSLRFNIRPGNLR